MIDRQFHGKIRNYNLLAICIAGIAFLALVFRAGMIHFEYPSGKDVHVLSPSVTITADEYGNEILFHGRLPQYFPAGSIDTDRISKLHLVVELEDLGDSDELLVEVWNANMEAYLDGKLIGTYMDGNPIHSLSSYYYSIPMNEEDNGKTLSLDYWRDRPADIPWSFPQILIGTSSELMHHVFFPYRLMIILASAMMYFSFTIIVCLFFYRNRPGIQQLIYSFILLLLGTFEIISACPASAMTGVSNLSISLVGQIGVMAFPAFLCLFYERDGALEQNMFFRLLSIANLLLGLLNFVLLLFGIGSSELDITLYLSSSLFLVVFFGYAIYLMANHRDRIMTIDFVSLMFFTISSLYLSFMMISGWRNILGLYMFTAMMVAGLSTCSYKVIIGLTCDNVAMMKTKTLEQKSYLDVLTGLGNRRALRKTLEAMDLPPEGTGMGIIYFDIDGMKRCNDTLGHEAGDQMLRNFAAAARMNEGEAYRIGGDEFIKVLRCDDEESMLSCLDEIRNGFSSMMDGLFSVTGYGIFDTVTQRDQLLFMLEDAEHGMRQSKKEGRA